MRAAAWVVVLGLLPAPGLAQSRMTFVPSLSVFTVYDDNLFARVEGSAGHTLELRPSFEGNYESARTRLLGLYSFDMQRSNHSSLNTFDARRHALASAQLRATPFTTFGVNARYDRTETPGEINIDTGLLGDRRQAERWQTAPSVTHRFNNRLTAGASYDWTTENLVEGDRGTLHVGRLGLTRQLSTRVSVSATYAGRYFVDDFDDHLSHALLLGWSQVIARGTQVTLSAGPKVTSYQGVVPEVAVAFLRDRNRMRVGIDYQHGETIVLGIQGPVAFDGATTRVTWPVRRTIELGVHAGASDIRTLDDRETRLYRGGLVGSWTPRSSIYIISASYGIDAQQGTIRRFAPDDPLFISPDSHILRHVVRVGLTIAPRLSRSMLPPDEAARAKGVTR
jgi:hypothetical protein